MVHNRQSGKDSLKSLLAAPLQMDITEDEDEWCKAVLTALEEVKDTAAEMKSVIDGLKLPQLDGLMRAIYIGLETDKNSQALLKWHAAVLEKSGIGSIVRYMCDRPLNKTSSGDKEE